MSKIIKRQKMWGPNIAPNEAFMNAQSKRKNVGFANEGT